MQQLFVAGRPLRNKRPAGGADKPSRIVLDGGSHTIMAAPFEYIVEGILPILNHICRRAHAAW